LPIPDVFICGHQQFEARGLGRIEQSAVNKPLPPALKRFNRNMTFSAYRNGAGVLWSKRISTYRWSLMPAGRVETSRGAALLDLRLPGYEGSFAGARTPMTFLPS
jgi:hypothetical protein